MRIYSYECRGQQSYRYASDAGISGRSAETGGTAWERIPPWGGRGGLPASQFSTKHPCHGKPEAFGPSSINPNHCQLGPPCMAPFPNFIPPNHSSHLPTEPVCATIPRMSTSIGPSRGGRRPSAELIIEITRSLTEDDLPRLVSPDPVNSKPVPIQALRASHHQLAQLLAQGRPDTEVSLITGYSPSRISILKSDPTFKELMSSYQSLREQVFVDTLERMKILGLSTLDELQERLENAPERWSNRELMEMADLMLVKPKLATPLGQSSALGGALTAVQPGQAVGVAIQVQFVKSDTPALVIEGEPLRGTDKGEIIR